MNFPLFVARRIAFSGGKNFSRLIIRIAIVAVSLSVAVMIASSALIAGFKSEISRKIFEFWGHIHITDATTVLSYEPTPVETDQLFYPSLDTVKNLSPRTLELIEWNGRPPFAGIRHIQAFAHKPGIIRTKTDLEGIIVKGIGPDFDWENLKPYLQEGAPISFSDTAVSKDILISRQTASRLQVGVSDKFILHFVKERNQVRRMFQICGIYKTGLEEYDRKFALCDIRQVQSLLGWEEGQVGGFELWVEDLRDIEVYNKFIHNEVLPENLLSESIRSKFHGIFEWLELQDYNEIVILSLMLAVAIINMITALLVLVLERSTMIGILKALGATNRRIRAIFLYQAAVITLYGMAFGNLLGLGFCWLQDRYRFISLNEADYYLSYAPVKVEWLTVLSINLGTLAITLIFLVLPSLVVSGIAPVRAIRFK